ncbi:EAL and HDOD domain-containing protein [Legionella maioricensis]|uniref:HDOD domain-containing protein n=1 Tax=Legionella maioricensis TaxID=2896528 RepID=A0A9X2D242_9GAMM|nr:HDOD domain-containing protein [Legionella maioricensis]MCL9685240.1 HDOD domain-containing protein [Legionella maioricensis]MCL9688457.1 HDOD domain-containing protein [Legionella maioricensis]
MLVKRPIYNQQLKCVAFEILSYQNLKLNEEVTDTLFELIYNSDTQLPLFVPFALKAALEEADPPMDNPIILKIQADEIETTYSLTELQESLFSIALLINTPQQLAWLNFAEYIALSEQLMSRADVTKVVQFSKANNRKVIAYNLNKPISFDKCKAMTMDYYCGDFLFKPLKNDSTDVAANKLNLLHLIQTLQHEDCDFNEVSTIIQSDPLLSFQLLKITNSLEFSGGQSIESIEQAIARIGIIHLKNWIMLLSMKNISDKPIEILESGLIRAHMAEELAKTTPQVTSQSAYTAGLLSILDCLINKPMPELISQITLTEELKNALTNNTGPLGELLSLVVAYEEGHWEDVSKHHFNGQDLSKLYIDSLNFVAKTMHN